MTGTTKKPPRRNRTGIATRARIIDAAIGVLHDKGFSGFTLQAVADRAEVLFGSVTHHYGTRDRLIAAMLDAILSRYRERFADLAETLREDESPIEAMVTWLLDDAVDPTTAGVFLELWAMASHLPFVAAGVNQLYDDAIDSFIAALGLPPRARHVRKLRESLYLLGTVVEGTSSIFGNRDRSGRLSRSVRLSAVELLVPFIEARLAEARAAVAASPAGTVRQRARARS
jgi:AcrR family transcriptional regulator